MSENTEANDILWGVAAIAAAIGRTYCATHHLIEKGDIPARRIRGRWVASRARLLATLVGEDDQAAA